MSRPLALLLCLVPVLAAAGPAQPPAEPPVRQALIIAYNGTDNPRLSALRYADDDGLAWAETLERLGFEVHLLTQPDADTRAQGSPWLARARPPSRAELSRAVELISARSQRALDQAQQSDVLLVYVGHGDLEQSGAGRYFNLADGRLDGRLLFEGTVDPLRAHASFVHLLLDACYAAGLVAGRGPPSQLAVSGVKELLAQQAEVSQQTQRRWLSSRPDVGVIHANTLDEKAYEWSSTQSGVLSHVLRSGLLGAADSDADQRVDYAELRSFTASAFNAISVRQARPVVEVSPPWDAARALVGPVPPGPSLRIPREAALQGRLLIEDERGVRLVTLNPDLSTPLELALPARREYWLRRADGREARLLGASSVTAFPAEQDFQAPREDSLASRGPLEASIQRELFALPFGRGFHEGYLSGQRSLGGEPAPSPGAEKQSAPWRWQVGTLLGSASLRPGALALGAWGGLQHRTARLALGGTLLELYLGLNLSLAPQAWEDRASLGRLGAEASVSLEPTGTLVPWGELAAGLARIQTVSGPSSASTRSSVATARATFGLALRLPSLRLRAGLSIESDLVEQNRHRVLSPAAPGIRVGCDL